MGVKVQLADKREVINSSGKTVTVKAGDTVEVSPETARLLEIHNLATPVADKAAPAAGKKA